MKDRIIKWYRQGLWSQRMVRSAALKGVITQQEAEEILKEEG